MHLEESPGLEGQARAGHGCLIAAAGGPRSTWIHGPRETSKRPAELREVPNSLTERFGKGFEVISWWLLCLHRQCTPPCP